MQHIGIIIGRYWLQLCEENGNETKDTCQALKMTIMQVFTVEGDFETELKIKSFVFKLMLSLSESSILCSWLNFVCEDNHNDWPFHTSM
jgi:hypothetical protein